MSPNETPFSTAPRGARNARVQKTSDFFLGASPMLDTPKSLLDRLQGDRQGPAWHELVELYAPLMRGWLGRYHVTAADADDIVQEVLAAVVQDLPHFKHNGQTGAFRAWLRQITVNRLRSHWRGRQR